MRMRARVALGVHFVLVLASVGAGAQPVPAPPPTAAFPEAQPAPPTNATPAPPTEATPAPPTAPPNVPLPPQGGAPVVSAPPSVLPMPLPDAEVAPPLPPPPRRPWQVGLDTVFHTSSTSGVRVTAFAPIVRATFWIGPVSIEPSLPFLYYSVHADLMASTFTISEGDSGFVSGNPELRASYHFFTDTLDVQVGGGFTIPLAMLDRSDQNLVWKANGYIAAFGARGAWDYWAYFPNRVTFFAPAAVRYVGKNGLDLGLEAAVGVMVYTGEGTNDALAAAQIGGHVGYASSLMEAGLRLKGVKLPSEFDDEFQGSIEPYVQGNFEHAYVGGGFIFNIDKPFGPFLDEGRVWGLHISGGARF